MKKDTQVRPEPKEMSSEEINVAEISDAQVVDYLERHPHFFENYPNLANRLYISHETNGEEAYSILQWQNNHFRDTIEKVEKQRDIYIKAFNDNCYLSNQFSHLIEKIIHSNKFSTIEYHLKNRLKHDFGYLYSKVYLNQLNQTSEDKSALKIIRSYLNGNSIYLGAIDKKDCQKLRIKRKLHSFVFIQLEYKLGYLIFAHPNIEFNQDKKNTALLDILKSVLSFKLKNFMDEANQ